jgi:ATP-binding protein involved in chromosome partitioning
VRKFRTYSQLESGTESGIVDQVVEQQARLRNRLAEIGTVAAVVSGKGGVGKSAMTTNLAVALARRGAAVGVLDGDLNGPSQGRMLSAWRQRLEDRSEGVVPATGAGGVRVMSMDLLQEGAEAPLRWRGPTSGTHVWQSVAETGVLREFLADVVWGQLDYLIVDLPPGTDKISRLLELVDAVDLALVVTTPSEISRFVVTKSIRLLQDANVGAIGIIGNMTAYLPPGGGAPLPLYPGDGVRELADATGIAVWGEVPFDPHLAESTDRGHPPALVSPEGPSAMAIERIAERIERRAKSAGGRP